MAITQSQPLTNEPSEMLTIISNLYKTVPSLQRTPQYDTQVDSVQGTDTSARTLPSEKDSCFDHSESNEKMQETPAEGNTQHYNSLWSRKRILSIDGGGIWSLCTLYILQALMEEIIEIEMKTFPYVASSSASPMFRNAAFEDLSNTSDSTGYDQSYEFRYCHYFDYIGGTNEGGIIAIMLGQLRFSIPEVVEHSENMWRERLVLANNLRISTKLQTIEKLHHLFQKELEEDMYDDSGSQKVRSDITHDFSAELSPILKADAGMCRTLVIAMRKNTLMGKLKPQPYLFRSYTTQRHQLVDEGRKRNNKQVDVPLISICLATAAAPMHVKSVKIRGIGGSFAASSMGLDQQANIISDEVAKQHSDTSSPIELLVSIGGSAPKLSTFKRRSSDFSTSHARSQAFGKPALQTDVDYRSFLGPGASDFPGHGLEDIHNPNVSIERVRKATAAYCNSQHAEIRKLAKTLVGIRRRRALSPFWETFAMGVRYRCITCKRPGFDRIELLKHVALEHKASDLLSHGSTKLLDQCRS